MCTDITFIADARTETELTLSTVNCTNAFLHVRAAALPEVSGTDALKIKSVNVL